VVICLASCRALILKGALKNDDDAVNLFGGETVIVDGFTTVVFPVVCRR